MTYVRGKECNCSRSYASDSVLTKWNQGQAQEKASEGASKRIGERVDSGHMHRNHGPWEEDHSRDESLHNSKEKERKKREVHCKEARAAMKANKQEESGL